MGSGKSTVGRRLARALNKRFLDTDHEITRRTGVNIALIFELEGEAGFRKRERQVLDEVTRERDVVVATGGGAILDGTSRRYLTERGLTIYLRTSIDQQLQRAGGDRNRPLLQNDDPRGTLEALFTEREPLYRQLADLSIDTDATTVSMVVKRILALLDRRPS
jgi:shikimate kinase